MGHRDRVDPIRHSQFACRVLAVTGAKRTITLWLAPSLLPICKDSPPLSPGVCLALDCETMPIAILHTLSTCAALAAVVALYGCGSISTRTDAQITGSRMTEPEYVEAMNRGLDLVRAKLEPLPKQPIKFSGNLFFAHGAAVRHISDRTLLQYVDLLRDAGVQRVDINPGVFPFRRSDADQADQIAKYDRVIQRIRDYKLELAINPEPNRGDMKISRLAGWEEECIALYSDLARRYRPDIFVLIHEPTTMAARMGITATAGEWKQFVVRTGAAVKKESPQTKLAAGGLAHEMEYFREFASVEDLDMLTVNIYDIGKLRDYNAMVEIANRAGKPIFIGETWRPPYAPASSANLEQLMTTSLGDERFRALDIKWLEVMAMYGSVMKMEAITAFWTTSFVKYVSDSGGSLDPRYNKQVIDGLAEGDRTATFDAFRELVKRYR